MNFVFSYFSFSNLRIFSNYFLALQLILPRFVFAYTNTYTLGMKDRLYAVTMRYGDLGSVMVPWATCKKITRDAAR